MNTFVICPVLNEWPLTMRMLSSLDAAEVDDVLILDNGSTDVTARSIRRWQRAREPLSRKLHRTHLPGLTIYELWNRGFARARTLAGGRHFYILVTNNDIELPPAAVEILRTGLRSLNAWVAYPDYDAAWGDYTGHVAWRETRGVLSAGGMLGACFMLAGHRIPWQPLITDLSYRWWYADDHLAECIEQEGGTQLRCVGLPVKHVNEGTAQHYPEEIYLKKLHDRGKWITRESRGLRAVTRGTIRE